MSNAGKRYMGVEDFLAKRSMPIPFSGCWIWEGATNGAGKYGRGGYGVCTYNSRRFYVHRLAYEHLVGEIPSGMLVCHRCDVRVCVNPSHLFLSDADGNHQDMMLKGRGRWPGASGERNAIRRNPWMVRGENNGNAFLSRAQAEEIRVAYLYGAQQRSLAKNYGIGQSQVSRICRGEHWR